MKKSISMIVCGLLVATSIASATSITAFAAPKIDPYKTVQAETNFGKEGIVQSPEVYNNQKITVLSEIEAGDYWIVKDVDFNEGLSKISLAARADSASLIEVRKDGVDGEVLGSIKISSTNGEFRTFTGNMKNVEEKCTIAFVGVLGNASVDYWSAEKAEAVVEPDPTPVDPDPAPTGTINPYETVEAENCTASVFAAKLTSGDVTYLAIRAEGGYSVASNVDFTDGLAALSVTTRSNQANVLEVRVDGLDGELLSSVKINPSDVFVEKAVKVSRSLEGTHDLYFVAKVGGTVQFDSWKALKPPVKPNPNVDPDPTPVDPDPTPVEPDPTPVDPDPTPVTAGITTEYTLNNWGSGYQVLVKVSNESAQRAETWTVKINKNDVGIDASWNVNIAEEGDYYVITPVAWNSVIEAGKSVEFGFQGSSHVNDKIELFADGEAKDDPAPVDPDPTPVDPDPTPVDPDPTPVDPDPTPVDPEPVVVNEDLALEYTINGQGSYTINFKVANNGNSAVNGWTLKLKKSQITIDNSWCVKVTSDGEYYVITPESWNATVNAGDGAYFGVQGSGSVAATLDYILE